MYCREMKTFRTLLSFESVKFRLVQLMLRPVMALTTDVVHEQGEMDADGGHPTVLGLAVVGIEVVVDVGRLVVVDVAVLLVEETFVEEVVGGRLVVVVGGTVVVRLPQLLKPNGFKLVKVVPFEQVPPLTKLKS